MTQSEQTRGQTGGRVFGFPLQGFGLFTSLLLSFATAFFTFFLSTTLAIFALLTWNIFGHHTVSYAASYRFVGLPAALLALAVALPVFLLLWIRSKLGK